MIVKKTSTSKEYGRGGGGGAVRSIPLAKQVVSTLPTKLLGLMKMGDLPP